MSSKPNLVVLSGAGISAESGLATFRDSGGLWNNYSVYEVATPEAFQNNPALVLDFYNYRRREVRKAKPNAAHKALAEAETNFNVQVVTQNVDDLHERAGSTQVMHVHGLITQARSSASTQPVDLGTNDISVGDYCPLGEQLRPHVVWFGEAVYHMEDAASLVENADIVLVVGTSLSVYPFAGLVGYTPPSAQAHLITQDIDEVPDGFRYHQGAASEILPRLLEELA
ncbi:SIR2 family NAD-dependent protein deacylase [Aliidiomarina sp. Khilg15.8]